MSPFRFAVLATAAALLPSALPAQTAPVRTAPAPARAPRLIVAISVDQLSSDLFAEYRDRFTGGFKRLLGGAVFPSGFQSHAATETCPGHSTILTGSRPARTGIIANDWTDQGVARPDKQVYCAEDERVPGSSSDDYTVSDVHLKVPTLGERMKAADPRTRVVSVAGKDRAAVMMGGHKVDELWWWNGKRFTSYAGRAEPRSVTRANAAAAAQIAKASPALDLPAACRALDRPVRVGAFSVGTGRFARTAGDANGFRRSPAFDGAVLALATELVRDMKLGSGAQTDVLSIGASATDYVGHGFGTEGTEMCVQLLSLDRDLERFFGTLDAAGIDYQVVLTADHGGQDIAERHREHGLPQAERLDPALSAAALGRAIGGELGIAGRVLWGGVNGDLWYDRGLSAQQRQAVEGRLIARLHGHRQVAAIFTRAEVAAARVPSGQPPATWTLLQRARASFMPERSGDLLVALAPYVTPVSEPRAGGTIASHGSFWDYDRRVPILFWRRGLTGFEQPAGVETVDILPTLAATVGLRVPAEEIDGRCLDLDAGPGSSCG